MATTKIKPDLSITTSEHPNAIRLRQGFASFGAGDLDAVRATMTTDCTWSVAGVSALAGTFRGWDEISGMFYRLLEITSGTHAMELVHVLADDRCAVAVYDSTATVAGMTRTMRFVLIQEVTPEGLTSATQLMAYDQPAADAHLTGIPQQG